MLPTHLSADATHAPSKPDPGVLPGRPPHWKHMAQDPQKNASPPSSLGGATSSIASEFERTLANTRFPCTRDSLVEAARGTNASNDLLNALDSLPEKDYANPDAVSHELAQANR